MDGLHVGIIPDGNRRWARQQGLAEWQGHAEGAKRASELLKHIVNKHPDVKSVTFWAFSTENFKRSFAEKKALFNLLKDHLNELMESEETHKHQIKIRVIGSEFNKVPLDLRKVADQAMELTKNYSKLVFNLAIGYGGKRDVNNALYKMADWVISKGKEISPVKLFENFLDVKEPFDIVIRTGGEHRLSGFGSYNLDYAELFFVDNYWPDFTPQEFDKVMATFRQRDRRYGE